jgi:hypothetical protein
LLADRAHHARRGKKEVPKYQLVKRTSITSIKRRVDEFHEAELDKLVQIPMPQAIQIATAKQPGTGLECRLKGHRVENREIVIYEVLILSTEGKTKTYTRFAISAIDGQILGRDNKR